MGQRGLEAVAWVAGPWEGTWAHKWGSPPRRPEGQGGQWGGSSWTPLPAEAKGEPLDLTSCSPCLTRPVPRIPDDPRGGDPVNTKQSTHVNTPRSPGSATLCSRNAHRWDRLASPPTVLGSGPFSEGLGLGTDL